MENQIKVNDKVETPNQNAIENLNALDLLKSAAKENKTKKTPQDHSDSTGWACGLGICWEMRPDQQ